jgi:PleD family two-component response regulator
MLRQTILIVDDILVNLKNLKETLNGAFEVKLALSGKDALAVLETECIDAAVVSMTLHDVTSLELYRTIQEHPDFCTIPILFLTSAKAGEHLPQMIELGARDFLVTPYEKKALFVKLHNMLDRAELDQGAAFLIKKLNQIREACIEGDIDVVAKLIDGLQKTPLPSNVSVQLKRMTTFLHNKTFGKVMDTTDDLLKTLLSSQPKRYSEIRMMPANGSAAVEFANIG